METHERSTRRTQDGSRAQGQTSQHPAKGAGEQPFPGAAHDHAGQGGSPTAASNFVERVWWVIRFAGTDHRLSDGQFRVLIILLMREKGSWVRGVRVDELARDLGKADRQTRAHLQGLEEAGYIERRRLACRLPTAYRLDCLIPGKWQESADPDRREPAAPIYSDVLGTDQKTRLQGASSDSVPSIAQVSETVTEEPRTGSKMPPTKTDRRADPASEILRLDPNLSEEINALSAHREEDLDLDKAIVGSLWLRATRSLKPGERGFRDRLDAFLDGAVLSRPETRNVIRQAVAEMQDADDPKHRRLGELYAVVVERCLAPREQSDDAG